MQNANKLQRKRGHYSVLRTESLKALTGDHPNAIWNQMAQMIIDEVWFKAVVRIREQADQPPLNVHLWNAFITGYGVKQSLAIRRLTDQRNDVASLMAIVNKIKNNRSLLTREVVVGHDGTPMDVGPLFEEMVNQNGIHDGRPSPLAMQRWSIADHAHNAFDRLRDAQPGSARLSTDRISDEVLDRLLNALTSGAIKRVRRQCDKYLAHADLSDLSDRQAGPTYNDIRDSIKTLVEIKQFLCADFFNHSGGSVVPSYQENEFQYLSEPIVPAMSVENYWKAWDDVKGEIEGWGNADQFRCFAIHADI